VIRTILKWAIIALVLVFGAIQLVPYGRDHSNPPVTQEAPWQNEQAEAIARKACYDCHSNETEWPWYSWVAPFSWLNQRDVDTGREELNFSEWDTYAGSGGEAIEVVQEGEMPPWFYWIIHWSARLDDKEKQTLTDGLGQLP
jgi:hypothetical protein